MYKLLLFGGTTEGRRLAGYCLRHGICADVSVTTDYGAGLLPKSKYIRIFTGKKSGQDIECMIADGNYNMVMDATHPFAEEISRTLRSVCVSRGMRYVRVLRESADVKGKTVKSLDELINYVNVRRSEDKSIRVLSTLGGKSLNALTKITGCRDFVYARVLPLEGIWKEAEKTGFPAGHIITGKGPFTKEQNIEHIRMCGAGILITRESGPAGGYPEKAAAAEELGIELITLLRPYEDGISFDEAVQILETEPV